MVSATGFHGPDGLPFFDFELRFYIHSTQNTVMTALKHCHWYLLAPILLRAELSVTLRLSVVGVAGWPVTVTGWPVTGDSCRGQPASSRR